MPLEPACHEGDEVARCAGALGQGPVEAEGPGAEARGVCGPHVLPRARGGLRVGVARKARNERDGRAVFEHGEKRPAGVAPPGSVKLHEAVRDAVRPQPAFELAVEPGERAVAAFRGAGVRAGLGGARVSERLHVAGAGGRG